MTEECGAVRLHLQESMREGRTRFYNVCAQHVLSSLSAGLPAGADCVNAALKATNCGVDMLGDVPRARWDGALVERTFAADVSRRMQHGAFLSGAGPTILAIAGGVGIADVGSDTMSQFLAEAVSESMLDVSREKGLPGTVHISRPSFNGVSSLGVTADGTVLWSENFKRDNISNSA